MIELLTIREMARRLSVPVSWLYARTRLRDSDFPTVRVGKYCRFDPEAVMTWLRNESEKRIAEQ